MKPKRGQSENVRSQVTNGLRENRPYSICNNWRIKGYIKQAYIILGANSERTLDKALIKETPSGFRTVFLSDDPELQEVIFSYGDGSVTRDSLLGLRNVENHGDEMMQLPSKFEMFFFPDHMNMVRNMTYLDNILNLLLEKSPATRRAQGNNFIYLPERC